MDVGRQQGFECLSLLGVENQRPSSNRRISARSSGLLERILEQDHFFNAVLATQDTALVGVDFALVKPDSGQPCNADDVEHFAGNDAFVAGIEELVGGLHALSGKPNPLCVIEASGGQRVAHVVRWSLSSSPQAEQLE